MQNLDPDSLTAMRSPLGLLERQAIELWNTVGGALKFSEIAAAFLYLDFQDFDALRLLLQVIRDEQNRKD